MAAFLIIGCVWIMVVGGAALKVRAERLESIDSFQRQLRAFAGALPVLDDAPALGPPSAASSLPAALRTTELLRRILAALLVTVVCSFLYALAVGSLWAWGLHLFVDNALLAYVALLVHRRDRLASAAAPASERDTTRQRIALQPTARQKRVPAAVA